MVADKEFYYSTYHGKLSEADVEGCLARAEYMLHSLTQDRLQDGAWEQDETLAKCVRMAHCALADAQHAQDTAVLAGGKVTSESVGKRELIADKPLTVKNLVHCAFGGLPHCEVTTE